MEKLGDVWHPLMPISEALTSNRWRSGGSRYNTYNIIPPQDEDRQRITDQLNKLFSKRPIEVTNFIEYFGLTGITESRGIASLLGLGIADALGASTEFIPFVKNRHHLIEHGFAEIPKKINDDRLNHRGQVGIWTDDCSMSLCLADSILAKSFNFDPVDLRYRFLLWLEYGLNNGGRPYSIGLGGNISISMGEFERKQTAYCEEGERFNNGNGSLMRLAPSAIGYHDNLELGMEVSANQSRTTHNGDEARECSRLLARIIIMLMNRPAAADPKLTLIEACESFTTTGPEAKSVENLARSKIDSQQIYNELAEKHDKFVRFNKKRQEDRNWQWKDPNWSYSSCRVKQQPGYIGSYCMDGLCMALHIAYHTNSFKQAVLWAVNMGGDCDTVGAIAGQIVGAMYGIDKEMMELYQQMVDAQTSRYHLFMKGYKLVKKRGVPEPSQPTQVPQVKPAAIETVSESSSMPIEESSDISAQEQVSAPNKENSAVDSGATTP